MTNTYIDHAFYYTAVFYLMSRLVPYIPIAKARGFTALFGNPAKKIPKPRQPYHEQKVLNLDQVKAFLQVCQGTRWEAVFCLAISSGMRAGELSGLRWTDIDWEQDRLQVVRQLQRILKQGLHFLEPKTVSSRRSIILGREMIMRLFAHRQ